MTEKLKPCPFCKSADIDPKGVLRNDGKTSPCCMNCGATAESVERWNTRPEPYGWLVECLVMFRGAGIPYQLYCDAEDAAKGHAESLESIGRKNVTITPLYKEG